MAQATTIKFGSTTLLLGDGATAETFTAPCGLTSLTMTINTETNSVNVPDCDDPDLASWLESDEVSKQMQLSGTGVLAQEAVPTWDEWWLNGGEKNVRWFRSISSANGGGYYQAPAILSNYEESGERGSRYQVNITITVNGKPTFTANP